MHAALYVAALALAEEGAPSVAASPRAAIRWADGVRARSPLAAAEAKILAGDPEGALEILEHGPRPSDPRWLRLAVDAGVLLARRSGTKDRLDLLASSRGWEVHARVRAAELDGAVRRRFFARVGLGIFAVCFALLALGGAREVLKPGVETWVFGGVVLGVHLLIRHSHPGWALPFGVPAAGALALVHAGAATKRRTAPGPRGRLLISALVLAGALGAWLAVIAELGLPRLLGRLVG